MSWVLAIDFGTSVTAGATVELDDPTLRPTAVEVQGSWRLPSCVLRTEDGTLVVGGLAARQAALHPTAFEPTPKRRMGDATMDLGVPVVVTDAIAAVLSEILNEAKRRHQGTDPVTVCLTHPASWATPRRSALQAAATAAGMANVFLLPEPVAAASWYNATSGRMASGARVAVYDLGGGTFDAAVVERNADGSFDTVGRPGGLDPLGGVDFDHALLNHVGISIEERDPALWSALSQPSMSASRRRRRLLEDGVTTLKEDLSVLNQGTLIVPEVDMSVSVTRSEFEELIEPKVRQSAQVLASTLGDADTTVDQLVAIYLVGGSSRIPLVASIISETFGVEPATLDEPKQVVAFGAATYIAAEAVAAAAAAPEPPPTTPPPPPRNGSGSAAGDPHEPAESEARAADADDATEPPPPPPPKGPRILAIAAAAVVIVGLGVFFATRPGPTPPPTTDHDCPLGESWSYLQDRCAPDTTETIDTETTPTTPVGPTEDEARATLVRLAPNWSDPDSANCDDATKLPDHAVYGIVCTVDLDDGSTISTGWQVYDSGRDAADAAESFVQGDSGTGEIGPQNWVFSSTPSVNEGIELAYTKPNGNAVVVWSFTDDNVVAYLTKTGTAQDALAWKHAHGSVDT